MRRKSNTLRLAGRVKLPAGELVSRAPIMPAGLYLLRLRSQMADFQPLKRKLPVATDLRFDGENRSERVKITVL